ncbi:transposase domain-containing protein [Streptomyces sp. NPDC056921]|uniref:transposase domain-containing protein n=1 Tax=Streptomyces sp. NPDC056921 TaxID=3345966 RepID=UPI0036446E3F
MFAPGRVGELTQVIPTELVDAVLDETGTRERRLRRDHQGTRSPPRINAKLRQVIARSQHLVRLRGPDGSRMEAMLKPRAPRDRRCARPRRADP